MTPKGNSTSFGMEKEIFDVPVSFKISKAQWAPYEKIIEQTGIKKGTLMREVFVSKSGDLLLADKQTQDNKRLLFLASKSSNNINQVAKKLNEAYRGGIVSEALYVDILNRLIGIEKTFQSALDKC